MEAEMLQVLPDRNCVRDLRREPQRAMRGHEKMKPLCITGLIYSNRPQNIIWDLLVDYAIEPYRGVMTVKWDLPYHSFIFTLSAIIIIAPQGGTCIRGHKKQILTYARRVILTRNCLTAHSPLQIVVCAPRTADLQAGYLGDRDVPQGYLQWVRVRLISKWNLWSLLQLVLL